MLTTLVIASALAVSARSEAQQPPSFSSSLHRRLEIDDIDREIQRLRQEVSSLKAKLGRSYEMAQRGSMSKADLQRETMNVRYQEARLAELMAFRDFRAFEKKTEGQKDDPNSDRESIELLLNLLKKQEALVKIELDYTTFAYRQAQALDKVGAVSREEFENVRLDYELAQANLSLSQARLTLTAKSVEEPPTSEKLGNLRIVEAQARVKLSEIQVSASRQRLARIEQRIRRGFGETHEAEEARRALKSALETWDRDKKTLEEVKANPTRPGTRLIRRSA